MANSKLADALAEVVVSNLFSGTCASLAQVRANSREAIAISLDQRLKDIRSVYLPEGLSRCPIVSHHGTSPCAFCITAAMREFILIPEA